MSKIYKKIKQNIRQILYLLTITEFSISIIGAASPDVTFIVLLISYLNA